MNGWTKFFSDGSVEIGTDEDVQNQKASWSRGRLTEMTGCSVNHDDAIITLIGKGEYWQSDDLEVRLLETNPKYVTRRIQKRIDPADRCVTVHKTAIPKRLQVVFKNTMEPLATDLSNKVGLWLVVELLLDTPGIRISFKEDKI